TEDELFSLVASAEVYSSHVLATAIVGAAHERGLPLHRASAAREEATNGVIATIGEEGARGREVVVGKLQLVQQHAPVAAATSSSSGKLAGYVAVDGSFAGAILLSARLRENAATTIDNLTSLGITHTMMLTGDAVETAHYVADQVGIIDI